jgi:hypothetical protein
MVGFVRGDVSVAGRIVRLPAPYFADGYIGIHRDTF